MTTAPSRRWPALVALACAGTMAAASVAVALPSSARITTSGLGPIKIAMTVAQVERAGGRELVFEGGDAGADCASAALGSKLYGLFSKGRLARIYVASRRYATRTKIRVGDSQRKVLARYGRAIARSPHKFVPGGLYLKLTVGNRRLVFETDGKRVTQISSGRKPEIDYVEGCA
jgi:hypothetical protein